ncbi:MAG: DUF3088 domain-containing protein [Desulfobacterales bacterium]|nr:DUF3088 domain-containing protein [Desulfobacterales bacterium]
MKTHTLFMLTPWTEDGDGPYYCPDCGVVEGFFVYSPAARVDLDIIHVDFQRPRAAVVDALGEENQSCPVLVLAEGTPAPESAKKSMTTGRIFIDDPIAICNFLGGTYGGVLPHP